MASLRAIEAVPRGFGLTSFLAKVILCAALCGLVPSGSAAADQDTKDPSASADRFAALVATSSDSGPIVDRFMELSAGKAQRSDMESITAPLDWVFAKVIVPGLKDRLAEKRYGNTVYIYWYSVIYLTKEQDRYIPVYLKLTFIRAGDRFQLTNFKFNSDLDKIELP